MNFVRWNDGPIVMICSDILEGKMSSDGSIQATLGVQKFGGSISSVDGRRVNWQLETKDGHNVKCRVDGKEYDLAEGNLFLVKTKDRKGEVEQVSRDLSVVQPDIESCKNFATNDPAVCKLLGKGLTDQPN